MLKRVLQITFGLLLGTLVTLAWFAISKPEDIPAPPSEDQIGGVLPQPFAPPPLRGRSPLGDSLGTDDLAGRHVAVFFGYTSCPDVCPLTLARLSRYRDDLPDALQVGLEVLFVSVDPDRDTGERVQGYLESFPGGVRGLIADDILEQATAWGVHAAPGAEYAPGEYLVEHTARTFILDPQGRVTATIAPLPDQRAIEAVLDSVVRDRR